MADPHVISALRLKRAELDGELIQAEKRIAQLRDDLQAIDRALRVFDPETVAHAIRPILRRKPPAHFRHGAFSRAILDVLRRADKSLTVREIASQLVRDYRLEIAGVAPMNKFISKVRGVLARQSTGLASEKRGESTVWTTADRRVRLESLF